MLGVACAAPKKLDILESDSEDEPDIEIKVPTNRVSGAPVCHTSCLVLITWQVVSDAQKTWYMH